MPAGLVRLRAPDLAGLVNALEHTDHRLLVELRALRQVRLPAEVVEPEDVRAALGRRADDLRSRDLGETEAVERPPEARYGGRQDAQLRPLPRMAPGERRVVE